MLENQGFNQQESQLDQNFCLNDKDPPPTPPQKNNKKKIAGKIKNQNKSNPKVKVPYWATKSKARNFLSNIS